jgi:hypothetical protein
MPKKIKKLDEFSKPEKGLSPWTDLWVVSSYASEINRVFTSKSEAEQVAEERNKELYDHYRKVNKNMTDEEFDEHYNNPRSYYGKVKVWTLADAIDNISTERYDNGHEAGYDSGYENSRYEND